MDYEEWDEDEETVETQVFENSQTVQDLAESHLQAEANRFMREERYDKHLFDARFGV